MNNWFFVLLIQYLANIKPSEDHFRILRGKYLYSQISNYFFTINKISDSLYLRQIFVKNKCNDLNDFSVFFFWWKISVKESIVWQGKFNQTRKKIEDLKPNRRNYQVHRNCPFSQQKMLQLTQEQAKWERDLNSRRLASR